MGGFMEKEVEMLIKANENSDFVNKEYPGKVIAIKNHKVIGVAKDTAMLLKGLSKEDLSTVLVTSVPPQGVAFIL